MKRHAVPTRQGFTLVELLVVIVIIGVLASFLVVGVMSAMNAARRARIRAEILGMAGAIENYKVVHASKNYPPSHASELQTHLDSIKPRSRDAVPALQPDEVLHFWLSGYSTNQELPLTGGDSTKMYDFDNKRLSDPSGGRRNKYFPPGGQGIPYVYFRKMYDKNSRTYTWVGEYGDNDRGKVYFNGNNLMVKEPGGGDKVVMENPSKDYIIVSAGLEDKFTKKTMITSLEDGTED